MTRSCHSERSFLIGGGNIGVGHQGTVMGCSQEPRGTRDLVEWDTLGLKQTDNTYVDVDMK